jgi:hypothetical protein
MNNNYPTPLKFTRGALFDMMIDVDAALDRFYTLANRAALTGDYGTSFHHPAFTKAHLVQDSDKIHEDLKNAYRDFALQLERNGFKIENPGGKENLWITWLK